MPINDIDEARKVADDLVAELIGELDANALENARATGMATSIYSAEIEKYRAKYNKGVLAELAEMELFDKAVAKALR